jgi:hypothetical protein
MNRQPRPDEAACFQSKNNGMCPQSSHCSMYTILRLAGALAVWKINYCSSDFTRCARYNHIIEGRDVPQNLLPNGVLLRHLGRKVTTD